MGVGCCKLNDIQEILVSHNELKILVELCQNKCKEEKDKKIEAINKNKSEILKYIKENDIKSANNKTDNLIKDENYVAVYDILDPIFDLIKTKCNYIISTNECPEDLRYYLDSLLYATIRLDIDELMTFKDKTSKIYGPYYIENAINDKDKKVNKDLIEKLKIATYSDEVIKERQNRLISENQSKPERANSPTRSILKKLNNNNNNNNNRVPSTNINSQSTIKENNVIGFNNEREQSPVNPGKNILEIETRNKKDKNVLFGQTVLDTIHVPKTLDTSKQNLNNSHNDNKINEDEPKEVQLFPTNTIKTIIMSDNQSNEQPKDNNGEENANMSLFGKTKQTFYHKDNKSNEQPKESENNDKELFRAETLKTLNLSVANPDNRVNPYEGNINDIFGQTVSEHELNDKKDDDKEAIKNKGEGPDPFDPNANVKNPFDVPSIDIEEEEVPIKSTKQKDINPSNENNKK